MELWRKLFFSGILVTVAVSEVVKPAKVRVPPTVTKEWLENALSTKIENFETSPGCNPDDGMVGVLYALNVTYDLRYQKVKDERPPAYLMIKTFPLNPERQEMLKSNNCFHKELSVYNIVLPELTRFQTEKFGNSDIIPLPFPKFIYGQSVDYYQNKSGENRRIVDPLENCIIMNDLQKDGGFHLADRLVGFDLGHIRLVIEAQAKLHAVSWAYKKWTNTGRILSKFPFLAHSFVDDMTEPMVRGIFEPPLNICRRAIEGGLSGKEPDQIQAKGDLLSSLARFQPLIMDVLALYFSGSKTVSNPIVSKDSILRVPQPAKHDEEPWLVLIHGDAWMNNQMFRYDDQDQPVEVKFVDLELTREGDPMCDVAYSIYASTTADLRKAHLDDLLRIYYQTFTDLCKHFGVDPLPEFSLSELKRRFHRAKIFGFLMSVAILPITSNDGGKQDLEAAEGMNSESDFYHQLTDKPIEQQSTFRARAIDLVRELRDEGVI